MCRKGRMFAPTHTWRKWHKKINTNQKRYAVASALAASALPSLVMARGHRIGEVAEIPCVVDDSVQNFQRTKQAITALKALGAYEDVEKARDSRKIHRGKGKMRGRRHTQRRGPLVVYSNDNGIVQAFRNLPGVELCHVERLNLLQLAPGGHMGRFIVWTSSAFAALNSVYGSVKRQSDQKKGYTLPRNVLTNSDVTRVINSDEIQTKLRPAVTQFRRARRKKNPLKNFGVKVKLNPYALALRRAELNSQSAAKKARNDKLAANRKAKAKKANKAHSSNKKANFARLSKA
jgi:large subunit ribosomal protein L4e